MTILILLVLAIAVYIPTISFWCKYVEDLGDLSKGMGRPL